VLLDFMMPIMDGPAMLKAMRKDPTYRAPPAVVMSSFPESTIAEFAKGRYAAFLRKPFKLDIVIDLVNTVINGMLRGDDLGIDGDWRIGKRFLSAL
jgi:CheY-like chemotaxis protein